MAVTPYYVASMTEVKNRLRLGGVRSDGETLIEDALEWARLQFFRSLGITRALQIQGYSYTESPSTTNETLRSLANQTELKMVRAHLLRSMAVLFKDGSGSAREVWNNESFLRNSSLIESRSEIKRLDNEIADALDLLSGNEALGDETSIRVSTMEPASRSPSPGFTIWGR